MRLRLPAPLFLAATLALADAGKLLSADSPVGRNLYVDAALGDDRATGLAPKAMGADGPLKTLHPAIRRAKPGDTIHLAPQNEAIRDIAVFHDVHGEPGRPITLDGHGATLTGCEPLDPTQWKEIAPGLFRCTDLLPAKILANDEARLAIVERWFLLGAGQMNHMGRSRKGKMAPLKKPAELQIGEWTYEDEGHAFYLRIEPGQVLADARIEAPLRGDGVQIGGDCSHLVIRNLTTTHPYNDGYGLHGKTRDVRFENIAAIECGDDGMSAHDDCWIEVDGFVSIGNATGLANTGASRSTNRRLYIDGNLGTDLLFFGTDQHTITDSFIRCTGAYSLRMWSEKFDGTCTLVLDNVLIERGGDPAPLKVWRGGVLRANRTTVVGLSIEADCRSLSLDHCLIGGNPAPEIMLSGATVWTADHNAYDLARFKIGNKSYEPEEQPRYQQATGQDAASRWISLELKPARNGFPASPVPEVGADAARLPGPPR